MSVTCARWQYFLQFYRFYDLPFGHVGRNTRDRRTDGRMARFQLRGPHDKQILIQITLHVSILLYVWITSCAVYPVLRPQMKRQEWWSGDVLITLIRVSCPLGLLISGNAYDLSCFLGIHCSAALRPSVSQRDSFRVEKLQYSPSSVLGTIRTTVRQDSIYVDYNASIFITYYLFNIAIALHPQLPHYFFMARDVLITAQILSIFRLNLLWKKITRALSVFSAAALATTYWHIK